MLPCTSTEMDGVLMTASTLMVEEFDQDPKIRCVGSQIKSFPGEGFFFFSFLFSYISPWPSVGCKIKILPRTLHSTAVKGLAKCRPSQLGS